MTTTLQPNLALPKRQTQLEQLPLTGAKAAVRAACSLSLATFGETFSPGWQAGRFHEFLAAKLEDCLRRKIKRLCISVPPGHGKSLETSVLFPAFALTKFPTMRFFQAGWNPDFATGFCREARNVVTSERYLAYFPEIIHPRVNRQDYWMTKLGGYYYACGIGGGTGMRADVFLIDDPIKDRTEANNVKRRNEIWSWITSTALTRLSPEGVMIVIQTRWHDDDPIGRLTHPDRVREMKEAGFPDMNFEVIRIEAICEDPETDPLGRQLGEALWPEFQSLDMLRAKRIEITPAEFDALYQQRPLREGGNLADPDQITLIGPDDVPDEVVQARGWDLALTEGVQGDYSVGARGGIHRYKDQDGKEVVDFYVTHIHRGKRAWPAQKGVILGLIEEESVPGGVVGLEAVSGFKIAAAEIKTAVAGRCIIRAINVHKDKIARANPWLAKIHAGRFFMVRGPWVADFKNELRQFPNGVNDDQIDGVSVLWETVGNVKKQLMA